MCIQVEKVFANLYRLSCSNRTVRASREHLEQEQNTHPTFGVYLRPQDLVHTSRNIRYQLGTYLGSAAKPWTPQAPVSCISAQASPENKYLSKIWGKRGLLKMRCYSCSETSSWSVHHSIWVVTVIWLNQTPKDGFQGCSWWLHLETRVQLVGLLRAQKVEVPNQGEAEKMGKYSK